MEKIYKIRDKSTGLFSKGGTLGEFNKKGKIWKVAGHVRSHLKQFEHTGYRDKENRLLANISNWEIVEYEIVEIQTTDLFIFISDDDPKLEYDLISKLGRK